MRLKLLFILTGDIEKSRTGTEIFAHDLSHKLRARGHIVDILCSSDSGGVTKVGLSQVIRIPVPLIPFIASIIFELKSVYWWIKDLRLNTYDAVISFGVGSSFIASRLFRIAGTKCCYYAIDTMVNEYRSRKDGLTILQKLNYFGKIIVDKYNCKLSDFVFCSCRNTLISAARQYQIQQNKLRLLYFGVNDSDFRGHDEGPTRDFLLVASEHIRKGSFFLVDCLSYLGRRYRLFPSTTIVGPANRRLGQKIADAHVNVSLVPPCSHKRILNMFPRFRCHVVPSGSEGFCLPVIEAAMFKRPSIVTKAGSLPEIVIDGRSGFVSDRDVSEFSEKMREIIKNNLWRKMGNSAYESSKRFRISVVAREMESQLYQINNITL